MDETEREAIRADGLDPDDPEVVTAIDFVRWELSVLGSVNRSPPKTKPLDVVANHRGLPTTTNEVWAEARLGWRASLGPRRL
jgi:hypothetical protein